MNVKISILEQFRSYLLYIKNYSKITIDGYCNDLIIFFKFIVEYLELSNNFKNLNVFVLGNIESSSFYAFLAYLVGDRNNNANTRKRKVASLKAFYKWLFLKYGNTVLKGKTNPLSNISNIENQKRLPKHLNVNEARILIEVFNKQNCRNPIRNNTILILFLNTGLRLSELVNIKLTDIDLKNKTLKVIGKGNKQRIVYLNVFVIKYLKKYLNIRNCNSESLFINNNGEKLSKLSIECICKKAYKLAGLNKKYTTHTLRHTYATMMYEKTQNILLVKEILGHSSIASTEIYTAISNNRMKEAVNKNPLNNYDREERKSY